MGKSRIGYWDAAKGFLILLVVICHMVFRYRFEPAVKPLFDCLILFSMPAFTFVSGYLSRGENAASKKSLLKLIVLYVAFDFMYIIWFGVNKDYYQLTEPYYVHWYLLAMFFWRIVTIKLKPKAWTLPLFLVIALLIGFWPDVDNSYAAARTICFYPFFLSGYLIPDSFTEKHLLKKPGWTIPVGVIFMAAAVACSCVISLFYKYRYWLTWHYMMRYYTEASHMALRLVVFLLAAFFTIGLLLALPTHDRKPGILRRWGRNSLWIYLFHRPCTLLFAHFFGDYNPYFYPAVAAVTIVIMFVFGSDFVAKWLNKWLGWLMDSLVNIRRCQKKKRIILTALCWAFVLGVLFLPAIGFVFD